MPFLLDLHDMKLVNFRTAVRYNLRRIDNENFQQGEVWLILTAVLVSMPYMY